MQKTLKSCCNLKLFFRVYEGRKIALINLPPFSSTVQEDKRREKMYRDRVFNRDLSIKIFVFIIINHSIITHFS